ncbi:MAG TPA: hypothetical protein VKA70_04710 [Blastocatellia bacterium]|nr:hypothetical protein [Blastocatellia bacterium]
MLRKLASLLLILSLLGLASPMAALAQDGDDGYRKIKIKRSKNGIKYGDIGINVLDGPGIVNVERDHHWMDSPLGATAVIGTGAAAGAVAGGVVKGKKGAVIGAIVGAGAATGIWLYKNRTEKRKIF